MDRTSGAPQARAVPAELAALGPFFGVDIHDPSFPPAPPWQRFSELLADLSPRVAAVRAALASAGQCPVDDIEVRVAASAAHLGLVARLLAPAIGISALGAPAVSLDPGEVYWQNELGGPFPVSVAVGDSGPELLHGCAIEAATLAFAHTYSLSPHVLWGNVASAANSAAQLIAAVRPDLASKAALTANGVLSDPRVEGGKLRTGKEFTRTSCCLLYRIADDRTAICGDCVLLHRSPS